MEVGFNVSYFLYLGALYDFQGSVVSTSSGLGMDWNCCHRGHDCAHKSFSKNKLVEDIVGTLAFLPLIYPYEPWRFKHDQHHAKTNMLNEDTAWQPVKKEEFDSSPIFRNAIIYGYGQFRTWMSIAHWLVCHFDTKKFRPNEVKRVTISLACVFAFMAVGWPLIVLKTGVMGWIKFWLMPWLGYHFWYMNDATWNWRLMKTILTMCHVYDKKQNYTPFDQLAPKESYPITLLKKVMPDYA